MNRVSLRIEKKKITQLADVSNHNQRLEAMKHKGVDASKTHDNVCLFKKHDMRLDESVKHDINARGIKPRKNAVVALEVLISATPDYFRPTDPTKKGTYDLARTTDWANANLKALMHKYGDNLIHVDLHLDESTPHIHAVVVPIMKKTLNKRRTKAQIAAGDQAATYTAERLDADSMTKRGHFRHSQTYFAKAVEHLDINRGIKGSRAKHTTLKQWGGIMKEALMGLVKAPKEKVRNKDLKRKVISKGFLGIGKRLEQDSQYYQRMSNLYQKLGAKNVEELLARETKKNAVIVMLEKRNKDDRDRAYLLEQFKDHPEAMETLKEQLKDSLEAQSALASENRQLTINLDKSQNKTKDLHYSNVKLRDQLNDSENSYSR